MAIKKYLFDKGMKQAEGNVSGIFSSLKEQHNYVLEVAQLSKRLSMDVERFSGLSYSAKILGISLDDLTRALEFQVATISNATNGKTKVFEELNLSAANLQKMNQLDQVKAILDALKSKKNYGERVRLSREVWRSAALLPIMNEGGSEHIDKKIHEAREIGAIVTDKMAKQTINLNRSQIKNNESWAGMRNQINSSVSGLFTEGYDLFTNITQAVKYNAQVNKKNQGHLDLIKEKSREVSYIKRSIEENRRNALSNYSERYSQEILNLHQSNSPSKVADMELLAKEKENFEKALNEAVDKHLELKIKKITASYEKRLKELDQEVQQEQDRIVGLPSNFDVDVSPLSKAKLLITKTNSSKLNTNKSGIVAQNIKGTHSVDDCIRTIPKPLTKCTEEYSSTFNEKLKKLREDEENHISLLFDIHDAYEEGLISLEEYYHFLGEEGQLATAGVMDTSRHLASMVGNDLVQAYVLAQVAANELNSSLKNEGEESLKQATDSVSGFAKTVKTELPEAFKIAQKGIESALDQLIEDTVNKNQKALDNFEESMTTTFKHVGVEMAKEMVEDAPPIIKDAFDNLFKDILSDNEKAFENFGKNLEKSFKRMLLNMAKDAIMKPIVIPILQSFGSVMGMTPTQSAGVMGQSTGGVGLSSLPNTGLSLENLGNLLTGAPTGSIATVAPDIGVASEWVAFDSTPWKTLGGGMNGTGIVSTPTYGLSNGMNIGLGGLMGYYGAQKGGILGGTAAGVGTVALSGGLLGAGTTTGLLTTGGSFMGGASAALASLGPVGWAALALSVLGGSGLFSGNSDVTPDLNIQAANIEKSRVVSLGAEPNGSFDPAFEVKSYFGGASFWSQHDAFSSEQDANTFITAMNTKMNTLDDVIVEAIGKQDAKRVKEAVKDWAEYFDIEDGMSPEPFFEGRFKQIADAVGSDFNAAFNILQGDVDKVVVAAALYHNSMGEERDLLVALSEKHQQNAEKILEDYGNLTAVNTIFDRLGLASYNLSKQGVSAANGLLEISGGVDALNAKSTFYYNNYYSESEKLQFVVESSAQAVAKFNQEMGLSGDSTIDSKESLRVYIETLDLTTESGQEAYDTALNLAQAMQESESAMHSMYIATQAFSNNIISLISSFNPGLANEFLTLSFQPHLDAANTWLKSVDSAFKLEGSYGEINQQVNAIISLLGPEAKELSQIQKDQYLWFINAWENFFNTWNNNRNATNVDNQSLNDALTSQEPLPGNELIEKYFQPHIAEANQWLARNQLDFELVGSFEEINGQINQIVDELGANGEMLNEPLKDDFIWFISQWNSGWLSWKQNIEQAEIALHNMFLTSQKHSNYMLGLVGEHNPELANQLILEKFEPHRIAANEWLKGVRPEFELSGSFAEISRQVGLFAEQNSQGEFTLTDVQFKDFKWFKRLLDSYKGSWDQNSSKIADSNLSNSTSFNNIGNSFDDLPARLDSIVTAFEQTLEQIKSLRRSIHNDKLSIMRSTEHFDEVAYQGDILVQLKERLTGGKEDLAIYDQIRATTMDRYHAEIALIQEAQSENEKLYETFKGIADYVISLDLAQLSPLSNAERLDSAEKEYARTLLKAQAGDEGALNKLTSVADSYLQESQVFYASSDEYRNRFENVKDALGLLLDKNSTFTLYEQTKAKLDGEILEIQNQALTELATIDSQIVSLEMALKTEFQQQTKDLVASLGTDAAKDVDGILNTSTDATGSNSAVDYYRGEIAQAYLQILGRAPEQAGIDYWKSTGLKGEKLRAAIRNAGIANDEIEPAQPQAKLLSQNKVAFLNPRDLAAPKQDNQNLTGEIIVLREEIKALRTEQAQQTDALIASNYDSSNKNADKIITNQYQPTKVAIR